MESRKIEKWSEIFFSSFFWFSMPSCVFWPILVFTGCFFNKKIFGQTHNLKKVEKKSKKFFFSKNFIFCPIDSKTYQDVYGPLIYWIMKDFYGNTASLKILMIFNFLAFFHIFEFFSQKQPDDMTRPKFFNQQSYILTYPWKKSVRFFFLFFLTEFFKISYIFCWVS